MGTGDPRGRHLVLRRVIVHIRESGDGRASAFRRPMRPLPADGTGRRACLTGINESSCPLSTMHRRSHVILKQTEYHQRYVSIDGCQGIGPRRLSGYRQYFLHRPGIRHERRHDGVLAPDLSEKENAVCRI